MHTAPGRIRPQRRRKRRLCTSQVSPRDSHSGLHRTTRRQRSSRSHRKPARRCSRSAQQRNWTHLPRTIRRRIAHLRTAESSCTATSCQHRIRRGTAGVRCKPSCRLPGMRPGSKRTCRADSGRELRLGRAPPSPRQPSTGPSSGRRRHRRSDGGQTGKRPTTQGKPRPSLRTSHQGTARQRS